MGTDASTCQPPPDFNQAIRRKKYMNIYHDVIRNYINLGLAPIPMKFRSKRPINKEWNKLAISVDDIEAYFDGTPQNIGILTGRPSGGLVDVDIDDADALIFASYFLPRTNCIARLVPRSAAQAAQGGAQHIFRRRYDISWRAEHVGREPPRRQQSHEDCGRNRELRITPQRARSRLASLCGGFNGCPVHGLYHHQKMPPWASSSERSFAA